MSATDDLIARIILREGGVADVGDGKGITRWGQTSDWLAQFNLPVPQNASEAAVNYARWMQVTGLNFIATAADDLADIVLDIAVMSSAPKAFKALQAAMGLTPDGIFGATTKAVLASTDRSRLARLVIAWDMEYQGRLITLVPQRAEYAAGWAARMAGHVRNLA